MTKDTKRRVDKWIEEKYKWLEGEISTNIAKGRMSEYSGDLLVHMIESVYKMDDDKVNRMLDNNKLGWWMLVGAGRELRSSTSPFYRTYRREKMNARENGYPGSHKNIFDGVWEEYDETLYECFKEAYNDLHFYQKALMDKYFYEGMSLQQIHEFYSISKRHLINDINAAINIIRDKCKNC